MYTWGYIKDASLAKLDLEQDEAVNLGLLNRFKFYANEVITQICSTIKPKHTFYEVIVDDNNIFKLITMPNDFISFSDDKSTIHYVNECGQNVIEEIHDNLMVYKGYNQVCCYKKGTYLIAYNARWFTFDESVQDDMLLDIPMDILDCIPSYIASQCYKIDDEYKASVYRNEYEIFLSRIDDTHFKQNKTFIIEGDW